VTLAEIIEASLEMAAERGGDLTARVYRRLFAQSPEMEAHFWRDRDGAIKGEMLTRVFEAILDFVGARRYAHHLIQCLVVTHAGYDVPPEVFRTFFGVVAEVIHELCAADWTAEMDAAWRQTLADLDYYVTHPDQASTRELA
jgi:hemoglobin-like flavoprotein